MNEVTEAQMWDALSYLFRADNQVIDPDEVQPVLELMVRFMISQSARAAAAMATQMAGTTLRYIKAGVDVAATSNIDLEGIQAVDGVPGALEMVVGVVGQTNKAQNGPWIMKDGPWQRLPGFATPVELSGIAFYVQRGSTQAGNLYVQPARISNTSDAKEFTYAHNANEALRSLVGAAKEETADAYETITGTTTIEEIDGAEVEVFTATPSYNVKAKVGNYTLKAVYFKQGTVSEVKLKKNTEWTYNPATGELWVSPAVLINALEGHELHLDLSSEGTYGMASGFVFRVLQGKPYYRFGGETDADLREAGDSLEVTNNLVVVNSDAEAASAMQGNQPKFVLVKGKESGLRLHNPPFEENVFTHTT
ncbi:hypothetical protein BWI93_19080 [Siphonobacter sp. BAB-5385]|uniref:hypothetical protein n=1 Tax=Siphonobacter sp. BAB-5385 TaxID=1864822 RepID=UPI000B9DF47E|nr:hypothetical protein [Siphonobacter sp. BAB-5385]OZI06584.1 hypothetical protein BWI93_19080 [Siphonobacter sp. BAB-5385]